MRARRRSTRRESWPRVRPSSRLMSTLGHAVCAGCAHDRGRRRIRTPRARRDRPSDRRTDHGAAGALPAWRPGVLVPAWSLVVFTSGAARLVCDRRRRDRRPAVAQEHPQLRVDPRSALSRLRAGGRRDAGRQPGAVVADDHRARRAPARDRADDRHHAGGQDIVASPNGWIDDCPGGVCTANETQTLGNNVLVCLGPRRRPPKQHLRHGTRAACSTATAGPPAIPT